MISDNLSPYVDGMNPNGKEDVMIQMSTTIAIDELPEHIKKTIQSIFLMHIKCTPFTLILYPRQCVISYKDRMLSIYCFPSSVPREVQSRNRLMQSLLDVVSTFDKIHDFFMQSEYSKSQAELKSGNQWFHSGEVLIDKRMSALN